MNGTPRHPPADEALVDWSNRRADARRNHERILAAAIELFTEQGLDATIPAIAARAGVGKATVYRSYPTKDDLIRAVAQIHVDWLRDIVTTASQQADAYEALSALIMRLAERLADDRLMADALSSSGGWVDDAIVSARLAQLVASARDQGRVRSDVTSEDIQILVGGIAHVLLDRDIRDAVVWRRYVAFILAALRPA